MDLISKLRNLALLPLLTCTGLLFVSCARGGLPKLETLDTKSTPRPQSINDTELEYSDDSNIETAFCTDYSIQGLDKRSAYANYNAATRFRECMKNVKELILSHESLKEKELAAQNAERIRMERLEQARQAKLQSLASDPESLFR